MMNEWIISTAANRFCDELFNNLPHLFQDSDKKKIRDAFVRGFERGYQFAQCENGVFSNDGQFLPRWHKIAEEGLPKKSRDYLVHHKESNREYVMGFTPEANKGTTPQNCKFDYWYDFPKAPSGIVRDDEEKN